MKKDKTTSPAYLWYPKDVFSSGRIDELSAAEECWYRRALDRSWMDSGVPADPVKCAAHIGKKCTVKAAEKILAMFFVPAKKDPSKMVNLRQEKERTLFNKKRQQKSEAGKRGMAKRWKQTGNADNSVITENNIPIPIPIPKDLREEGEGETPPLAPPPSDFKFEDSAFDHPAVIVYQEKFGVKCGTHYAKEVAARVKDMGTWIALISDKIALADEPLDKRRKIATWFLKAYDERVAEKQGGGKGFGKASGVLQSQPFDEIGFQEMLRQQEAK